jgi:hypothetical protein
MYAARWFSKMAILAVLFLQISACDGLQFSANGLFWIHKTNQVLL